MNWSDISFDFSGAHVLVAGGTSGIGRAVADGFLAAGADVSITGTRQNASAYEDDLGQFDYHTLDIEDAKSIEKVARDISRLDVLVNSAGLAFASQGLDEHDPDIFERAVAMHLSGGYRLAHRLTEKLVKSDRPGGGAIVGIASMTSFMGNAFTLGYGAAKTGLLGMVRGMAVDLGPKGVRVNAVAAGLTESRMTAGTFADPQWTAPTLARTPMGRLGKPEDIAGAVMFVSSSAASWITGQVIMADGGYVVSG